MPGGEADELPDGGEVGGLDGHARLLHQVLHDIFRDRGPADVAVADKKYLYHKS